jgi:hypothetical protein
MPTARSSRPEVWLACVQKAALLAAAPARLANEATIFLEARLFDHGNCPARFNPLCRSLLALGPNLALPFHQERIDFHLAGRIDACLIEQFVVSEEAHRLGADPSPDSGLFESFPGRRLRRSQPLYRPALGNDPPSGPTCRHQQNLERGVLAEAIGQHAVLQSDRWLGFPFSRLARNLCLSWLS